MSRRLLLVTGSLKLGGAERQLMQLAAHLHRSPPWTVSIALLERDPGEGMRQLPPGLRVASVRAANPLASLWALRRMINNHDIAYSWLDIANVATSVAAAFTATPVVWSLRGSGAELSRLSRSAARLSVYLNGSTAAMIANSQRGKDYFVSLGYRASKIAVVPNGIDTGKFVPRACTERMPSLAAGAGHVIGMLARYHPVKRHAVLIEAFADALVGMADTRWTLALVGAGVGDANPALKGLIERRGLQGRVLLLGPREDVECLLPGFSFVVCASEHEGSPNSLLEALACGVPVLSTPVGDVPAFLKAGGRIADFSREGLTAGLVAMMRMSDAERRAMGLQGRELVEREFSLQSSMRRTLAVLSGCTRGAA